METDAKERRLCELMLFKELGGTGYDVAIDKYRQECPAYYAYLSSLIKSVKDTLRS
jgi:hypothetical protein